MAAGMRQAGELAVRSEKVLIGTPGPPPSAPGSPPHRRSGKLQAAQGYRVESARRGPVLIVSGATPGKPGSAYAKFVHARRPWVREGVTRVRADIYRAIGLGVAGGLRSGLGGR